MKIIKKGTKTLPKEIVYVTRCKTCGCKFTYAITDIDFSSDTLCGKIWCPQCNYRVKIPFIKRKYKGDDK